MIKLWVLRSTIKDELDYYIEAAFIEAQIALAKEGNGEEAKKEKEACKRMGVLQDIRQALLGRIWKPSTNLMTMRKLALGDFKGGREEKDKT